MRSSWPGSSDPSQRRRSRCARSTAGDRYPTEPGARRRAGPSPRARVPAGRTGSRTDRGAPGPRPAPSKLRRALEPRERREEAAAAARGSATKGEERKPKRVNNQEEGKGKGTKYRRRGATTKSRGGWRAGQDGREEMKSERGKKASGVGRTKRVNGGGKKRSESEQTKRKKRGQPKGADTSQQDEWEKEGNDARSAEGRPDEKEAPRCERSPGRSPRAPGGGARPAYLRRSRAAGSEGPRVRGAPSSGGTGRAGGEAAVCPGC